MIACQPKKRQTSPKSMKTVKRSLLYLYVRVLCIPTSCSKFLLIYEVRWERELFSPNLNSLVVTFSFNLFSTAY